ncbi:MAG: FHA domain-containing protein [Aristaeellaceae bacterium]
MKRNGKRLVSILLCIGLLAFLTGAAAEKKSAAAVAEEASPAVEATDAAGRDDDGEPARNETADYEEMRPMCDAVCNVMDGYGIGLHVREEAYNPETVVISGTLYAEEGLELVAATVSLEDGSTAQGEYFLRYGSPAPAEGEGSQEAVMAEQLRNDGLEIDYARAGFALTVNLSHASLTPGTHQVRVTLILSSSGVQNMVSEPMTTNVTVAEDGTFVADLMYLLTGVPRLMVRNGEANDYVPTLQANLIALEYLDESGRTGVYDAATQAALRELCEQNDQPFSEEGVTAALDKLIASGCATPKQKLPDDFLGKALAFMNSELSVGGLELPYWALIAAVAGLLVLVILAILIVKLTTRKRRAAGMQAAVSFEHMGNTSQDGNAMDSMPEIMEPQPSIISTGDEETMDLQDSGLVIQEDGPTIDMHETVCHLRIQMHYKDMVKEATEVFSNQKQLVIGVGEGANIRTNPADRKVSRMHGVFEVRNGKPCYTDRSKNGTMVNGAMELHNDSVELRVGVLYQLEMGEHTVLFKVDSQDA